MQFDKKTIWLSVLATVLLVSNLATLAYLKQGRQKPAVQNVAVQSEPVVISTSTAEIIPTVDEVATTSVDANEIVVKWNEWPVKVNAIGDVFDSAAFGDACVKAKKELGQISICDGNLQTLKAMSIGKVLAGKYAGGEVFLLSETPDGPVFRDNFYRVIKLDDKLRVINKNSDDFEYSAIPKSLIATDSVSMIVNLETPQEINIPNSTIKLRRSDGIFNKYFLTDYKNPKKVFEYQPGKVVYWDEAEGCYLLAAGDGSVRQYDFALPFVVKVATTSETASVMIDQEFDRLKFTEANTFTNESYSIKPVGGCGSTGCLDYASFITTGSAVAKSLRLAANAEAGDKFYEFSDLSVQFKALDPLNYSGLKSQTAKEYLEGIYKLYYPGWDNKTQKMLDKMPFEAFVKKHPVLFWQDPFGNYVRLSRTEFAPGVECGKPVIYLYPQKTTTVAVQVRPNGGITKSEPTYGDGWQVEAEPNGRLKNLADQKTYDSLFWEGGGINYLAPKEGFVVARKDVEKFLNEKLALLGLNKKETADFMEFWLPRMQAQKYYLVRFIAKNEFDRIAPLTIEPRPETVIRVFMDYQGLAAPVKVQTPIIKTPIRKGFTVVEWGGALHE